MDQQEVSGGQVTLGDSYSVAQIGLPFYSDLETLNISIPLKDKNSIQGRQAKVNNVSFRVHNSRGGYIGPNEDDIWEAFTQDAINQCSGQNIDAIELFTGDIRVPLGSGFGDGGRVFYRQVDPLPITIGAIMPEVTVGGYVR